MTRDLNREILPIPDRPYDGPVFEDAKDPEATFPPIEPLRPPPGAPNVLIVLHRRRRLQRLQRFRRAVLDPDRRAAGGGRAQVQPLPHHGALLADPAGAPHGPQPPHGRDGRDHRDRDFGARLQLDPAEHDGAPCGDAQAQRLRDGTVRQVPRGAGLGDEPAGPVPRMADRLAASSTSTASSAARPTSTRPRSTATPSPIEQPKTAEEGYHFTEDMTDQAIDWIKQQKALMPDKPFFVYYAPGATHAPHHVPPEWSDKYKGAFDDGWDALRERTFARQKELGVIPPDAELTERPQEIPAWDEMPDDLRPVLARQMEVYAGFLEHTDHHVGRLVDALVELGILHDTLVYYVDRRQRRLGRGHADRLLQRARRPERRRGARDDGVHGLEDRRVRHAHRLQPLRGRLGARDGHAVPVDEAGRLALGRDAERDDRALARRHRGAEVRCAPSSTT